MVSQRLTQKLTIIAKDPSVKLSKPARLTHQILTAQVEIPMEDLAPGPRGYRAQVIDYDVSKRLLYPPLKYRPLESGMYNDPFAGEPDEILLEEPSFHAQNVYAIVMRILSRFEFALGRRVGWNFYGHQINIAPHAFAERNAFYSFKERALLFGYFPNSMPDEGEPQDTDVSQSMVFTCLSHDIVAHETTHALLDGLRERYTDPSSPEQAGFHEGFADIVALLSIFSLPAVVEEMVDWTEQNDSSDALAELSPVQQQEVRRSLIAIDKLELGALRSSLLLGLGYEIGAGLDPKLDVGRGTALRRSVMLEPNEVDITSDEYQEPHRRGEVLVAAMMNAFIEVWRRRIETLGFRTERKKSRSKAVMEPAPGATEPTEDGRKPRVYLDRQRVVEEGATIADHLLTMSIRALDYCPPTDLEFCDFLSALLTADREVRPDDSRFQFRASLLASFQKFRIPPTSKGSSEPGIWEPPGVDLCYERTHLVPLLSNEDEMFRFIWENRWALGLEEDAYTRVISVRPCVRINPDDGFVLRETVAEYYQQMNILASELKHLGIKTPQGMPESQQITLYGGGALIFDEFGRVKFHIRNRLLNPERQTRRLQHLWDFGHFTGQPSSDRRFAEMHQPFLTSLRLSLGRGLTDATY